MKHMLYYFGYKKPRAQILKKELLLNYRFFFPC